MIGLNIIFFLSSYLASNNIEISRFSRIQLYNNFKMQIDDYNTLNSSNRFSDGLKLYNAKVTKETTIKWLYTTLNDADKYPKFVINDLVNTLTYSIKEPNETDLYIAYIPVRFEDPHFIGCFSIKPDKKLLSIEQICTNPYIKETNLGDFKKKLKNLAATSGVVLYPQPLKYLINPRYFLEFSQLF
tara:strand:- start:330 stop:887 length:558 start_codon:yes stop_codon:yes gene_type:complete